MKAFFACLGILFFFNQVTSAVAFTEGFKIGAVNSNETIKQLKTLTGLSISEIEWRGRPCQYTTWPDCSDAGFLGKDERFIERLLIDNTFVLSKGFSHQQLAAPLLTIQKFDEAYCEEDEDSMPGIPSGTCKINGVTLSVKTLCTLGFQESIFNDSLRSSCVLTVKNQETSEELTFADYISPEYIHRYGFYEGETPYRVEPQKIIDVFNFS